MKSVFSPKYDVESIEAILQKAFGDKTHLTDLTNKDLIIPTVNLTTYRPLVFSTYEAKKDPCSTKNPSLWGVVRASTAAPTLFKPVLYEDNNALIDGGLAANNPALLSYGIISQEFGWESARDLRIISIGTGIPPEGKTFDESKNMGIYDWASPISKTVITMGAQMHHEILSTLKAPSHYVRLNPELLSTVKLDSTTEESLGVLRASARCYIVDNQDLFAHTSNILRSSRMILEEVIRPED